MVRRRPHSGLPRTVARKMTRSGLNCVLSSWSRNASVKQQLQIDEGVTPSQRFFSLLLRYRL
jgi:hypothetical protein